MTRSRREKAVLELSGVSKLADGRAIISGIDWRIRRGEHWALLGANGAGKTTLLRIVAGNDWPSDGTVKVLGKQFGRVDLRELRKSIGWVASSLLDRLRGEDTALAIALSGLEASIGLWREFGEGELRRARSALRAAGAEKIAEQRYETLSQGERQRVLIARALIRNPALLILDEPCAGLDPAARESFLEDLEKLAARRRAPTIIFVTHHIEEISPFVTHGLILKDGTILAAGRLSDVCTSAILGNALGRGCAVERTGERYALRVSERKKRR